MEYCEAFCKMHELRRDSGNWAEFLNENPFWANELFEAEKLANNG